MAWRAKVKKKTPDYDAQTLTLDLEFYDDVAPTVILSQKQMVFPAGTSGAEVASAVKLAGAKERRSQASVTALADQITIGQEIVI